MLAVSLSIAKWQIYDPLHASGGEQAQVHIWPKLIIASIVLGMLGMVLCISGNRREGKEVDFNNMDWSTTLAALGGAALGLGLYFYALTSLSAHGYAVRAW